MGLFNKLSTTVSAAVVAVGLAISAPAANAGVIQLGFIMDSSGSIGSSNWNTIKGALANAVNTLVPTNGAYENSVVNFSNTTTTAVNHVLIDSVAARTSVANAINAMAFIGNTTNMAAAFSAMTLALTISPQLSPVATYEGKIVGENIVNGPSAPADYSVLPSSVYTIPAYSSVGLTEEQAREAVPNLRVSANDMAGWFSAKSYAETAAWSKILIDEDTDHIVGAHIIGHHGEDLINLFVLAMENGITASALKDTIFAYPTFSSDVKNMF